MRLWHNGNPTVTCSDVCHKNRGSAGGTDYALSVGTPLYAPAAGMIRYRAAGTGGWTLTLIPDGFPGDSVEVMHLTGNALGLPLGGGSVHVSEGQHVGYSGGAVGHPGAGSSTGPHSHEHADVGGRRYGMPEYLAMRPATPPPKPPKPPKPLWEQLEEDQEMFMIKIQDAERRYRADGGLVFAVVGVGYWLVVFSTDAANTLALRWGNAANVTYDEWDEAARVSGVDNPKYSGAGTATATSTGRNLIGVILSAAIGIAVVLVTVALLWGALSAPTAEAAGLILSAWGGGIVALIAAVIGVGFASRPARRRRRRRTDTEPYPSE
jgi:hypothetical protein